MGARNKVHPLYAGMLDAWEVCRDVYEGQRVVKAKQDVYLPATSGMIADGFPNKDQPGTKAYEAYLTRAYFPDLFGEAVEDAVGTMHKKPPVIELPPKLQGLLERATDDGETLPMLLRRINFEQLKTGRLGLMGDITKLADGTAEPKLVVYKDSTGFNWDDRIRKDGMSGLRFVALDETGPELNSEFNWVNVDRVRVLAMVDPDTKHMAMFDEDGDLPSNAVYGFSELKDSEEFNSKEFTIVHAQGLDLKSIPFTFVNTQDLNSAPAKPPLIGLAELCLAIYRGEADFRQNLFMQGQDTLVKIGKTAPSGGLDEGDEDKPIRTGAGSCIELPLTGDAKYIGVSGKGLTEQSNALENDYKRAQAKGAKITSNTNSAESGDALAIRVAGQTADLAQVATTGASALKFVLQQLAVLLGEDPNKVVVTPNLDFADANGDSQTLLQIVQAKMQGAPISDESIHEWMVENKFTSKTYEEELALLGSEEPRL